MEAITAMNANDDDESSRFGEEIACHIRAIVDPYRRAIVTREIRELVFNARFPAPPSEVPNQFYRDL